MVIQRWLAGYKRDKIAFDCNISAGAVTNIVNDWRMALGSHAADELRDLAVGLAKIGINPAQCAAGLRITAMMKKMGVQEDNFESFIASIYSRCYNDLGLTPERIGSYITELLAFSNTVPFSQIPNYILQKTEEKKKLEEQIEKLKGEVKESQTQKSKYDLLTNSALVRYKITKDKLKWYWDLREELGIKYGIPVNDISKFAKVVYGINQRGYNVDKVIKEFSDLESARNSYWDYKAS